MQKVIPNPGITGNIFELSIKDEKQNHALL